MTRITENHSNRSTANPRHRLLAKSRQWHLWGGLVAAVFLLVVGATGIVLNYKKPIFRALGLERGGWEMAGGGEYARLEIPAKSPGRLTTTTGLSAAAISLDQALAVARENLGDVALERIELKDEHGKLFYRFKSRSGLELHLNAITGAHFTKGEYEKVKASPEGAVLSRTTDWGKVLLDLHTGKIGGEVGKAVMTLAAVLLILLTVSGVYLWLKPLLIRRRNARERADLLSRSRLSATHEPKPSRLKELAEV